MTDADYMRLALAQAQRAAEAGEVPVGAVVVYQGQVIGEGHNAPIQGNDPTAHAEVMALRAAATSLGNYRLEGCTLYVTLEPCAMCSGAMLYARLSRVVYGARDPKTGVAGSVLDLFSSSRLNHQTQVIGGVLADECAALLQNFFQQRRLTGKTGREPLREDALRTPLEQFESLPDYPWPAHYTRDLPSLAGLRMHYLDEGPRDADVVWLCLHGYPTWSYLYRHMLPVWLQAGHRVVVPDLMGFGKSDKPKKAAFHRFSWHRQVLLELVQALDLRQVRLVGQDWGGMVGLTLPHADPSRYCGLLAMATWLPSGDAELPQSLEQWRWRWTRRPFQNISQALLDADPTLDAHRCEAYEAPFADLGQRAVLQAFAALVPDSPEADGALHCRHARDFWRLQTRIRVMVAGGQRDAVCTADDLTSLGATLAGCSPISWMAESGHFTPEYGTALARAAIDYFSPDKP